MTIVARKWKQTKFGGEDQCRGDGSCIVKRTVVMAILAGQLSWAVTAATALAIHWTNFCRAARGDRDDKQHSNQLVVTALAAASQVPQKLQQVNCFSVLQWLMPHVVPQAKLFLIYDVQCRNMQCGCHCHVLIRVLPQNSNDAGTLEANCQSVAIMLPRPLLQVGSAKGAVVVVSVIKSISKWEAVLASVQWQ